MTVEQRGALTFGELFAGIGGFSLGLERAGMKCKWQVEIEPYARAVLKKHWPDVPKHDDVRTFPPTHTHTHRISASISSAVDSPAKTSASQAGGQDSQEQGPVFGTSSLGSLANYDRDTSSWRTSQLSLLEEWTPFSGRFPRSGMTRSGTLFQLLPLVRRTVESGYGLWPTPDASMGLGGRVSKSRPTGKRPNGTKQQITLNDAVRWWPTPTAAGFDVADVPKLLARRERIKAKGINGNGFGLTLGQAVKVAMWPTPTACQGHNNSAMNSGSGGRELLHKAASSPEEASQMAGGQLNPTWVEWLMGFPLGWTALDASATPSSRKSLKSSGARSSKQKRG